MTTDKSIENAIFSLKMEGFHVDSISIQKCKKLLENEISWEQYMEFVKMGIRNDPTDE